MKDSLQTALLLLLICLSGAGVTTPVVFAQTPVPALNGQERMPPKLYPRNDWPSPVHDEKRRTFALADVL